MLKSIGNRLKKFTVFVYCVSFLASAVVFSLPLWAQNDAMLILEQLIIFAPRWWLFSFIIILSMLWRFLSLFQRYTLPLLFYISLMYLDFQLPDIVGFQEGESTSIKLVTVNMGEGSKLSKLKQVVKYYHPDLLLLQEIRINAVKDLQSNYTYIDCEAGLCLLSKYPFERVASLSRAMLNGYGHFAMSYQLTVNGNQINLSNVHFETPREILLDIIKSRSLSFKAKNKAENRQIEASLVGDTIRAKKNVVIAGDFNMPDDDPIYKNNFSWLTNALNESGFGFNHTKYIDWQGMPLFSFRIDHIIYSKNITARNVEVLDSLGGDHRPVMATLEVFH